MAISVSCLAQPLLSQYTFGLTKSFLFGEAYLRFEYSFALAQPTFGLPEASFALAQPWLSQYTFGL